MIYSRIISVWPKIKPLAIATAFGVFLCAELTAQELSGRVDCQYGSPACSVCIPGVPSQFSGALPDLSNKHFSYRMRSGRRIVEPPTGDHVQGVSRLADAVRSDGVQIGRVIITDSGIFDGGLTYFEQQIPPGLDAVFYKRGDNDLLNPIATDVRSGYKHPGGTQAHGDTVAIAMDDGKDGRDPAVFFFRYSYGRSEPIFSGQLRLEGVNDAGAVGYTMLEDRRFLLSVWGGGQMRFFQSRHPSPNGLISVDTAWDFLNLWAPETSGDGEELGTNFGGAQNLALINDCDGTVFMVAMNSTATIQGPGPPNYQWMQLYRITRESNGNIAGINVSHKRADITGGVFNNKAFRFGGDVYVTRQGNMTFLTTERRTKVDDPPFDRKWVDGNVYASEEAILETCDVGPVIYEHKHYRGKRFPIYQSEPSLRTYNFGDASSICVSKGATITLGFDGREPTILNGPIKIPDLQSAQIENPKSADASFSPTSKPQPCLTPVLYEDNHLRGESSPVIRDIANIQGERIGDGNVSSVCVPAKHAVTLYSEHDFRGDETLELVGPKFSMDLRRDFSPHWGDRARSVAVVRTDGGQALIIGRNARSRTDGSCMHKSNFGRGGPTEPENAIILWNCDEGAYIQRTWFFDLQQGYIRNAADPSMCMQLKHDTWDNGNPVIVWNCDDAANRPITKWIYESNSGLIRSIENPNKCLHKKEWDWRLENPIHLWDCGEPGDNNTWNLEYIRQH